jgi:hypothetical protein
MLGNIEKVYTFNASFSGPIVPEVPTVLKNVNLKVPRIMFRNGKVNQHIDLADGTWKTDSD